MRNEFHGPVYLAGDFKLPPPDADKFKTTVFYNTLTLGVYNEGAGTGSDYRAGRVLTSQGTPNTFTERGHPYLSKNDNFPGFRGFLGGLRLDATEDKGFQNLFNWSSSSAVDVSTLEACVDEAKVQTTPSLNLDSVLAYGNYQFATSAVAPLIGDIHEMTLSFTKRNRFNLIS